MKTNDNKKLYIAIAAIVVAIIVLIYFFFIKGSSYATATNSTRSKYYWRY